MVSKSQEWSAQKYATHARFVADLATPVMQLLAPQSGESILDLGCGDGVLTRQLADLGCRVIGVDASENLIAAAQNRNVDARVMDGQQLAFDTEFDAVFSNAALHWMLDSNAVLAGVWRALRPGGRFVAEMGGAGNCQAIAGALEAALQRRGIDGADYNPWYFPEPDVYRRQLEAAGFRVESIELHHRPTRLPGDIMGWLETFGGSFIAPLPESERVAFLEAVAERLRPQLYGSDGIWTVDYYRLRFDARKPAP